MLGPRTPGVDRATVASDRVPGRVEAFLGQIRDSLKSGEFEPVVPQVSIPKASGKTRKLGPTVTDRVVQASLKAVLEPIFEADFKPCSYGFRPNRRAQDAIDEIHFLASHCHGSPNCHGLSLSMPVPWRSASMLGPSTPVCTGPAGLDDRPGRTHAATVILCSAGQPVECGGARL
jgi:retron-type reverse transcriptase